MILIIFIVNISEFAYFFFNSGESHEGRQRLLVLLSAVSSEISDFTPYTHAQSNIRHTKYVDKTDY